MPTRAVLCPAGITIVCDANLHRKLLMVINSQLDYDIRVMEKSSGALYAFRLPPMVSDDYSFVLLRKSDGFDVTKAWYVETSYALWISIYEEFE